MRMVCYGNKATFENDVKESLMYRRSAGELKRNAMLGENGGVLDPLKMQKLTIAANTAISEHKPLWASVHNHQEPLLKTPVYTNAKKLGQFLTGHMDPNNGNPSENFSIRDCHPSDTPYDPNNRECVAKGIENFDKLRATYGEDQFNKCSADLVSSILSGELLEHRSIHLDHALHNAMVSTSTIASDPFDARFHLQPSGEVIKTWLEQIHYFFSKPYLNNLAATWEHVQEKRARVLQGMASGAIATSADDGNPSLKKRAREIVSPDQKLCTTQSFVELTGSTGKCKNKKCLLKHANLQSMTKEEAIQCINKYGSSNSRKKLLAAAETHFNPS
jgi:hypothetical protein